MAKTKRKAPSSSAGIRLNKYIADAGVCSRRKADELIESGQVILNGKKVYEHGVRVDPESDRVTVSGKPIRVDNEHVYYIFNKPKNVVTTMDDPEGRPKVGDFFRTKKRIFPVGRLDWDTEGLLLLTNDGRFAQNVAHPKKEITKTYLAKINGKLEPEKAKRLVNGVTIVGGRVSAKLVEKVKKGNSTQYQWVKIIITEGKNRQVRRMFEKVGYDVIKLQRVAIGELKIGALKKGDYRELSKKDIEKIFRQRDPEKIIQKKKSQKQKSTKR